MPEPVAQPTSEDELRRARIAAAAPKPLVDKMLAAELSGERKPVTAVFADVVGSTALMENIDPEDWTAIINQAFDLMSQAIYRYEGTIAQLQGDAMLAFFGAPVAHEDDPERAVRAALDMVAGIEEYARQLKESEGIDFQIRAGINSGLVLAGRVGSDLRYEHTALGDAINVAARMQAAARPGMVVITADTYRFIAPIFEVIDLGRLDLKGKSEPVQAYEVIKAKDEPGRKRGLAGLDSPMVGRDEDLERLVTLLGIVRAGRGRPVCVIGEAGIGKSRLLEELKVHAVSGDGSHEPMKWVEGHCLSFGRNLPYHLLLDVIRSIIGVPGSAEPDETREALVGSLADLPEESRGDLRIFLSHLLTLPLDDSDKGRIAGIDPADMKFRYIGAIRTLLGAVTRKAPLVLLCEDVHWADEASVEVVASLLPYLGALPILFVLTTRTEQDGPGWGLITGTREVFGDTLTELKLNPLSQDQSRLLVSNLLEIESLPAHIRDHILNRAEGNPFFVEEIIRTLIDYAAIVQVGPRWVATPAAEKVRLPDTLQGLLLQRIDRLPEETKHVLRLASVIGRQFPAKVLEKIVSPPKGGP